LDLGIQSEEEEMELENTINNVSHNKVRFLAFVLELPGRGNKICVLQARKTSKTSYSLSFWKWKVPQEIIKQESLEDPNFSDQFRRTSLESDGNLYQLLIFRV